MEKIDTNVIILAGGFGSRSANPDLPKSLHKIMGKEIISWQLDQLEIHSKKFKKLDVTVVGGYKADNLREFINETKKNYNRLTINFVEDTLLSGTWDAFKLGVSDNYCTSIVIMGDLFFNLNVYELLQYHHSKSSDLTVVTHPNLHPQDSDLVELNFDKRVIRFHPKDRIYSSNWGNCAIAGIIVLENSIARNIPKTDNDLIKNSIVWLSENNFRVFSMPTSNTIKDMGTQERIRNLENKFLINNRLEKTGLQKGAVFLDLDGTLIPNQEIKNVENVPIFDDFLITTIKEFNTLAIPLIIVTNQPGIAKGFFSEEDFLEFKKKIETQLVLSDAFIDDWYVCPHHPEKGWIDEVDSLKIICNCRKPKAGLLDRALKEHKIEPKHSIYFGDSHVDYRAAQKMKIKFEYVNEFGFKDKSELASKMKKIIN